MAWVVAFHLWEDAVPGGWLGVGLFFTLSGYLIVGILDTELDSTDSIDLARFFERRIRRLLPAALVAITFGLVLSAVLGERDLPHHGVDALLAILNVFNWHWAATDNHPGGPIDHFWSLAIEEQFYLVVPTVMALTRKPVIVMAGMAAIGVGGVALWWESRDAYVATPVRATEIAVGAAFAMAAARFPVVRQFGQVAPPARRAVVVASITSVAVAVFLSSVLVASWSFSLLPDAIGVQGGPQLMALCWAVLVAASTRGGALEPVVALAPLRWIGTRSYAIYLYHWPMVNLTDWSPAVIIAVTLAAAEVSYRVVEMPVRSRSDGRSLALLALAASLALALTAIAAR